MHLRRNWYLNIVLCLFKLRVVLQVHQQEEEVQLSKERMKLRDEKLDRLESLGNGIISADSFVLEENNALKDKIQILQARTEQNPELTRLTYENISLLKQLGW